MIAVRARRRPRWRAAHWAAALIVAASFTAVLDSPYANVEPGPTPELTSLVLAAQGDPSDLDATYGTDGQWFATTINATPLRWWELARCKVTDACRVFPLATGANAQARADDQMSESVRSAAQIAGLWIGPADHRPTLEADLGDVGGPSAGLMLTLAFIDAATDGDLTGGRSIAGTGTMNSLSEAGPVGGVEFKVAGARAAGATVFFVPDLPSEVADAQQAGGDDIEIVPVAHVADAVRWLCEHQGVSTACTSAELTRDRI